MTVNKPEAYSDLKLLQTNSEEIRQAHSSTESNMEMDSMVIYTISNSIIDDDILPNFRSAKSSDTSTLGIGPKKFAAQINRKYFHEHTELGPRMAIMTCPNCLLAIESIVRYNETSLTHVAAACLFPLCLCVLPYCTPYFRNAEHYCPMCSVYLGTSFAKDEKYLECCGAKTTDN